jgi:hypothetical protein
MGIAIALLLALGAVVAWRRRHRDGGHVGLWLAVASALVLGASPLGAWLIGGAGDLIGGAGAGLTSVAAQ